jgi:hypothetical protein
MEQNEAQELPYAVADAAATLHSMGMTSAFLIPSVSVQRASTPSMLRTGGGGLNNSPAASVKTSSFYTKPLGKNVGRMDRSLGLYGGMSTNTIAEEERRSMEFRKMVKKDNSASSKAKSIIPQIASPNGTISRQELYNVEQQWESHRDRVAHLIYNGTENDNVLTRNLNLSKEANTQYALRAMELTPAFATVRQNAAEQRAQSAHTHEHSPTKTSGFNFPRLPSKKINALHSFMAQGRDAKGPPVFDGHHNHNQQPQQKPSSTSSTAAPKVSFL